MPRVIKGEKARQWGARWNQPGTAMVYAASTSSLAILEQLVQVRIETGALAIVAIDIPDDLPVKRITETGLPRDWRRPKHEFCSRFGSEWAASGKTLTLCVPSAVNVIEDIVLLNPLHPAITRCKISEPIGVHMDRRLVALIERAVR